MALGVNIVSDFNASGINKAIKDFKKLEGAGKKTGYALLTLDKAATNGLVNLTKFAAAVGVAAGVIGYKLASAAYESQKVMKQTEAIIKSTGGAAGVTADQVAKLSTKLSMQIGVDDELIQKSANLLLTFKQVQDVAGQNNDVFTRAVTLSQDLGNVFGSADAAAMQLGKALSDPEKGISALRRAGINFNEQQKEQIKTLMKSGDILGAQKLILAEVEAQVGGTAAASATGFDRMRVAVGNVAEEFGAILIPYIERFANFVINSVVPYMQRLAEVAGKEGIGGVIRTLAGDFLNMTTNMGAVGNTILGLVTGFVMLKAAALAFSVAQSAATIAVTAFGVAWNATGIGLVAAAIAAVVIGLIALYVKFEGVRKVVNLVGTALKFVFVTIAKSVFNVFATAINALILAPINAVLWVLKKFGADVETVGFISMQSFDMMGDAAEEAAKRMSAAQKKAGRPFEQLVGDYRGEMPKLVKATNDSFVGTGGAGKAVETAKEKLKKFIDALKGVTGAQRSYRDAMKGITKANEDLTVANDRLAKAQENFRQVVAGFGIDSRQGRAQRQVVVQAQRALERAGYGVEEAVFAVAQAEQELAEIRLDPDANATAIRQAEIDLAEAKLRVQEATDSQAEATQELADAQSRLDEVVNGAKEGSQAYKDALDELKEAQKAQQDAIDAVTDAYERQRDAVDALREAEEKLAELRKTTPDKIESKANKMLNTPLNIASPNMELPDNVFTSARRNAMLDAIPAFAAGGLVTSPTIGLIGEAGAEAVVPLDRLESGMNITLNINAGMGTDAAALGDEIVNVLQRYNRRNGALPLKVA